ncbi:hypothetical protein CDCA_CDCA04G1347 [Cyanidium caldarium]|uniref:Nuclear pore complex protein Nup85 n=1 Tax=Cyanidium caldarium TaxID=2771 RepID=A0AAV9ISN0_CYACA|nr:hypothetical protein CDCA_CDCA04G1347 [Cyanidium caldarium]
MSQASDARTQWQQRVRCGHAAIAQQATCRWVRWMVAAAELTDRDEIIWERDVAEGLEVILSDTTSGVAVAQAAVREWVRCARERPLSAPALRRWARAVQKVIGHAKSADVIAAAVHWAAALAAIGGTDADGLLLALALADRQEVAVPTALAAITLGGAREAVAADASTIAVGWSSAVWQRYMRAVLTPSANATARRLFLQAGLRFCDHESALQLMLQQPIEAYAADEWMQVLRQHSQADEARTIGLALQLEQLLQGRITGWSALPLWEGALDGTSSHAGETSARMRALHTLLVYLLERHGLALLSPPPTAPPPPPPRPPNRSAGRSATTTDILDDRLRQTVRLLYPHLATAWPSPQAMAELESLPHLAEVCPRTYTLYDSLACWAALETDSDAQIRALLQAHPPALQEPLLLSYLLEVARPGVQAAAAAAMVLYNANASPSAALTLGGMRVVLAAMQRTAARDSTANPQLLRLLLQCLASFARDRTALVQAVLPALSSILQWSTLTENGAATAAAGTPSETPFAVTVAVLSQLTLQVPAAQVFLEALCARCLQQAPAISSTQLEALARACLAVCRERPARSASLLPLLQYVLREARHQAPDAALPATLALQHLVEAEVLDAAKLLRFLLKWMPPQAYQSEHWPLALRAAWMQLLSTCVQAGIDVSRPQQFVTVLRLVQWMTHEREADVCAARALAQLPYRWWHAAQWADEQWRQTQRADGATAASSPTTEAEVLAAARTVLPTDMLSARSLAQWERHLQRAAVGLQSADAAERHASDAFYGLCRMVLHGAWRYRTRTAYVAGRSRWGGASGGSGMVSATREYLEAYARALPEATPIKQAMLQVLGNATATTQPEAIAMDGRSIEAVPTSYRALTAAMLMATCGATLHSGLPYHALRTSAAPESAATRLADALVFVVLAPASPSPLSPGEECWRMADVEFMAHAAVMSEAEARVLDGFGRRLWARDFNRTAVAPGDVNGQPSEAAAPADDWAQVVRSSWHAFHRHAWPTLLQHALRQQLGVVSELGGDGDHAESTARMPYLSVPVPEMVPLLLRWDYVAVFDAQSLAHAIRQGDGGLRALAPDARRRLSGAVWSALANALRSTDEAVASGPGALLEERQAFLLAFLDAAWQFDCPADDTMAWRHGDIDPLNHFTLAAVLHACPQRSQRLLCLQQVIEDARQQGELLTHPQRRARLVAVLSAAVGFLQWAPLLPPSTAPEVLLSRLHFLQRWCVRDARHRVVEAAEESEATLDAIVHRIQTGC